jgi:hypothetical protein
MQRLNTARQPEVFHLDFRFLFFSSDEHTSVPTIGQKRTLAPRHFERANPIGVVSIPGCPPSRIPRPALFFVPISSTIQQSAPCASLRLLAPPFAEQRPRSSEQCWP